MTSENRTASAHRYRARWILPLDGEPIENGVVEIRGGHIAALDGGGD